MLFRTSEPVAFMPMVHLMMLLGAVWGFYGGLRQVGFSGWLALAVCLGLLYSPVMYNWGNYIMPDVPAAAAAIFAMGMLLRVSGNRKDVLGWSGLTAGVFVAYQMRPAYLFLVALVPLLGLLLRWRVARERAEAVRPLAHGAALVTASVLPFLAFCCFRLVLVGHWGLVSFGGYNVIGISGQFLTEPMIPSLPEDLQPLAEEVLRRRAHDPLWPSIDPDDGSLHYQLREPLYNRTLWTHFVPAMTDLWPNQTTAEVNAKMSILARHLILARPKLYGSWIVDAYRAGLQRLFEMPWTTWPLHIGLCFFLSWALSAWILPDGSIKPPCRPAFAFQVMGMLACMFALSKLLLIVLVETPLPRYLDAAFVFLPALPGIFVVAFIERLSQTRSLLLTQRPEV